MEENQKLEQQGGATGETTIPIISTNENDRFVESIQPDTNSHVAQSIARKLRTNLGVLLGYYIFLYFIESLIGFAIIGSSHDLVLLLLAWFSQDQYRNNGLELYCLLAKFSIAIDFAGTLIWVVLFQSSFVTGLFLLFGLFTFETVFKVASIRHASELSRHIQEIKKSPGLLVM